MIAPLNKSTKKSILWTEKTTTSQPALDQRLAVNLALLAATPTLSIAPTKSKQLTEALNVSSTSETHGLQKDTLVTTEELLLCSLMMSLVNSDSKVLPNTLLTETMTEISS